LTPVMESGSADITRKLSLLVRLAVSDRHFAGLERDLIIRIGHQHRLSDAAIESLIRYPLPSKSPLTAGNDEKVEFLKDCVAMVKADRKVLESEVIFFRSIAQRMGFRKEIVDYLLELDGNQVADAGRLRQFFT